MKAHVLRLFPRLSLVITSPLVVGCLYFGGGNRIEFDESARLSVRFSNVQASHDFHTALAKSDREPFTESGGFMVLFIAGGGGDLYHETEHYNAQVRLADVNRDGEINGEEATAYAEYVANAEAAENS